MKLSEEDQNVLLFFDITKQKTFNISIIVNYLIFCLLLLHSRSY